ncbi:hypothetical protein PTSG_09604 [Salpingoeca rosetta]|uniref:Transcription factor TFIIIC triple barrel domain-containing protein n=1 Tax=Salpingoeca rosetta (strain ATCC 50818 / BSB-021) TaxID=946362 RepID=F2ULH2_SALR5|nr:uncharacterized protein PTSG_09604 [Salpingoeca rosetta]EGD77971.1 hypothetical protein PTSG_09604 [Salpingoeca rosetta]|eukprot:XP_004990033.1 hypothetical protein PTSG_09604 [Salpingoeca rosetta]
MQATTAAAAGGGSGRAEGSGGGQEAAGEQQGGVATGAGSDISDTSTDSNEAQQQQQQHNGNEEDDNEWETEYVVATVHNSKYAGLNLRPETFKVVGAHTAQPVFRMGSDVFVGQYSEAFGTNLILQATQAEATGRTEWKYLGRGIETMTLLRAELHEVEEEEEEEEEEGSDEPAQSE